MGGRRRARSTHQKGATLYPHRACAGAAGVWGGRRSVDSKYDKRMPRDRTEVLTLAALCAFAANSILCRLALGGGLIDAATFTVARVGSGALALIVLARLLGAAHPASGGSWPSAWLLFLYAVCFSFSYLSLSAATGALILFASVQITMIAWGLLAGERPTRHEWIGLVLAFGGLVGLVAPGLTAPAPVPAA